MENTNKKILLGVKNNNVIIADLRLTTRNGYPEFTASFNEGEAFNIDIIDDDYKNDYFNDYWDCCDDKTKLQMLQDGDITKEEARENFESEAYYNDYHDYKDCGCTDIEIEKDGKTINFETIACGQHDVRECEDFKDMIFTNEKTFNDIMYLWDKYHMKEVKGEILEEIKVLLNDDSFKMWGDDSEEFIKNNINWNIL